MRRSSDRLIWSGLLLLSEALSFEVDAVGVVDEAIEDCVGDGGVADDFVPAVDGQLAGDDDRASFISVLDNLKQITALVGVERLWPPVIKNEQIETSDSAQHLGVTAIGAAECEGGEETRHARYATAKSSRQALLPRAQASQLLPTPHGPVTRRLCRARIQSPAASFRKSARSRPRIAR